MILTLATGPGEPWITNSWFQRRGHAASAPNAAVYAATAISPRLDARASPCLSRRYSRTVPSADW